MRSTMDNKQVYEKFDWSKLTEERLSGKIDRILNAIPDDVKTILDVGCGNGIITNALAEKYKITGVDRSNAALESVQTDKLLASSDNIPLEDRSYDMVFSSELLEHLDDKTLNGTIAEMDRLTTKYLFITVPFSENPDKLSIKCPECRNIYNRPNHLRSFNRNAIEKLFPDFETIRFFTYGNRVRYYNKTLLKLKRAITPSSSWIPYFWISRDNRETICPYCEHEFTYPYRFCMLTTAIDILNVIISPKKPYWLFVLLQKKQVDKN